MEPTAEHFKALTRLCASLDRRELSQMNKLSTAYLRRCVDYLSHSDKDKLKRMWRTVYPEQLFPEYLLRAPCKSGGSISYENLAILIGTVALAAIAAWFAFRSAGTSVSSRSKAPSHAQRSNDPRFEDSLAKDPSHAGPSHAQRSEAPNPVLPGSIDQINRPDEKCPALEPSKMDETKIPDNYKSIQHLFPTTIEGVGVLLQNYKSYSTAYIIDPAGTAFASNTSMYDSASGLSNAIYRTFELTGRTNSVIGTGKFIINKGEWKHGNITMKLLHAVGPHGDNFPFTDFDTFKGTLRRLVCDIVQNTCQAGSPPVTYLMPFISGHIFLGKHDKSSYQRWFTNFLQRVCALNPNIRIIHNIS